MADKYLPICCIDNGHAEQKRAFWEGEPKKSSIKCESSPSRAAIGSQAMTFEGNLCGVYEINGHRWTAGSNVHDPENTRSGVYATSELNTVLINHSLIESGFSGREVRLATGLPFNRYFDEDGARTTFISSVKDAIKTPVVSKGEKPVAIITEQCIYPESTAAWIDYALDEKTGDPTAENTNGVAVVDVGGNTTDVTYILPGNKSINIARSGTKDVGALHMRDKLSRILMNEFTLDEISDQQLDNAMKTRQFKSFDGEHDIKELVAKAVSDDAQKILNFVSGLLGKGTQLDYIVFVGGGAQLLSDYIQGFRNAVIPKDPQFSNARGMLKHWTFVNG